MDKTDSMERAFILLEAAADNKELSFAEAGKVLGGIAPSTLSRLLKKLCASGMLEHASAGFYRTAPRMNQLAAKILHLQPRHELLRPIIQQLAMQTGQSAAYFEKTTGGAMLLAKHEMPEAFHYIAEGQINNHMKTQGFIRILYDENPPEVLVVMKDDNRLLRRVVAPIKLPEGGHGAIGISLYVDEIPKIIQQQYAKYCRECAAHAEKILQK